MSVICSVCVLPWDGCMWLTGHTQDLPVIDDDDPNIDILAFVVEDESPHGEVRSAVANTDDPTMPSSTFRAWVVGLIWAIIIPGVNQFFFFRNPSITITSVCLPSLFESVVSPLLNQVLAKQEYRFAVDLPHAQVVDSLHAEGFHLRCLAQPGTIHHQRARHHHHHGRHRGWPSIRRECRSSCQPIFVLTLSIFRPTSSPSKRFSIIRIPLLAVSFDLLLASTLLIGFLSKNRPVVASHVDPADWLLDRWRRY
jgi:hypothetical protein